MKYVSSKDFNVCKEAKAESAMSNFWLLVKWVIDSKKRLSYTQNNLEIIENANIEEYIEEYLYIFHIHKLYIKKDSKTKHNHASRYK